MSTATAVEAPTQCDVIVRGLKASKSVELEGQDFILRMTPAKAYELASAMFEVLGEIR